MRAVDVRHSLTCVVWPGEGQNVTSRADPMLGRTLGDFVIRERIGAGGIGEVFRAEQTTLGREAVIKVLTRNRDLGMQAAERFLREARLASRLDHPYAAHVYAFGAEPDGMLWIAMELVRGIPLDRLVTSQGPLPLSKFVPFFERLTEVLHAAHEQGIVHRDVKPANVMVLSRTGRLLPKLLDLGIARSETPKAVVDGVPVDLTLLDDTPLEDDAAQTNAELLLSKSSDVTQAGMVIGTPHFMAPEQWSDASKADSRSDIYSLGVLAYQVLTGRLPFKGHSIRSMARAHAQQVLPPLGEGFPEALHEVLVRATAKLPADRYQGVLDFSAALRVASGLEFEPATLPQIDDRVRETVLAEAPQPIAESVAMLEAARTPRQAVDAVAAVQRVVTRHLALMALSARARIGAGTEPDSEEVTSLLKRSAAGRIDDDAWRALAAGLVSPFAGRREAYPVPELVMIFFTSDGRPGMGALAMERLAALNWPTIDSPQDELIAFLQLAIPALSQVLSTLSFIFDYPLVVRRNDAERWMGTRRSRRSAQDVLGPQPADGEVVLLDAAGSVVLTLSPLVQLIAPSGGATEELFYLDGPGRYGARMVALPGPFERQDPELWTWFSAHIIDVMSPEVRQGREEVEPYKGLSPFTANDADNYFGREREAQGFANRLRAETLLAVVGPSGAGKSSFIFAGVVPLLPKGWRSMTIRPGNSPLSALARRMGAERLGGDGLVEKMRRNPLTLAQQVATRLPQGEMMVLVVDQFEELMTLCPDAEERRAFARLLCESADMPASRVRVVMTLRDDFLIQITQLPAFRERLSSALQLLATPAIEDLLRVVVEPAKRIGFGFDDETLPRRMVDAVAEHSGALALLSFSASQMWQLRDRHLRQMRAKTYEALGGVAGALAHHAEATLAQLAQGDQGLVRDVFRQLVTSQGTRAVLSRQELLEVLGSSAGQTVVDSLVNARLLVAGEGEGAVDRIEIIHESLIQSWPRLVGWLREDAETVRLRDALRSSARQWASRGRARGLLWRGEALAEFQLWKSRFRGGITKLEHEFALASQRDEARGRLIRRAVATSVFVALSVALVLVAQAYRSAESALQKAEASAQEARHRLASLRQEQGRLAMLDNKPMEALAYLDAARSAGATGPAIEHMLNMATWLTRGELRRFGEADPVSDEALSPDGKTLALFHSDGRVTLWGVESGTKRAVVEVPAISGAFGPNGLLALGTNDGKIQIADAATGRVTSVIEVGSGPIFKLEVSGDGKTIATSAFGDKAHLVAVGTGKVVATLTAPGAQNVTTHLSHDGKFAAMFAGRFMTTTVSLRELRVVNVETGTQLLRVPLSEPAREVTFASNAVIAGLANGELVFWNIATQRMGWTQTDHSGPIRKLELSPSGDRLLSLGSDGKAIVWDAKTGSQVHSITLSSTPVRDGFWANDEWLMVQLPDGVVQKINARTAELDWRFVGDTARSTLLRIDDGRQMLTTSEIGVARIWDAQTSGGADVSPTQSLLGVFGSIGGDELVLASKTGWFITNADKSEPVFADESGDTSEPFARVTADGTAVMRLLQGQIQVARRASHFNLAQTLSYDQPLIWFVSDSAGLRIAAQTNSGDIVLWSGTPFAKAAVIPADARSRRTSGFFLESGDLVTGSTLGELEVWNPSTGTLISKTKLSQFFFLPLPSQIPDTFLTAGANGSIQVWRLSTKALLGELPGMQSEALGLSLQASGELLSEWTGDGVWATWDVRTAKLLSRVPTQGLLSSVAVTRADVGLATTSGAVRRWPLTLSYSAAEQSEAVECASLALLDDSLHQRSAQELLETCTTTGSPK